MWSHAKEKGWDQYQHSSPSYLDSRTALASPTKGSNWGTRGKSPDQAKKFIFSSAALPQGFKYGGNRTGTKELSAHKSGGRRHQR